MADGSDPATESVRAHGRPVSLWRNRDFTAFWIGETLSLLGSQVTLIALPLAAVLTLDISTAQLGVLRFAEFLPFLAFTLLFGVWADRR
ncbi:MAG TPA: MFS transporter, partial [Streptosporangiaceae bacterium]